MEKRKKSLFSFVFHPLILHLWRYAPKVLTFGNAKENEVFFCISLTYSYLWRHAPKVFTFGNAKENEVFFCISLTYSYLCTKQKNIDYDIY